ncbi:hypothetical protein L2U69_09395 [Zavarzinia compransoris]|uniref:hypothetical protein n=1 Tax=Zavarzinia marina TaxID=2911065 RepID=UPI001F200FED|nr:hypothetical protein [Zavarzinia marina]MCF4165855.1 hypothetical protein [Zavarzinia marina]
MGALGGIPLLLRAAQVIANKAHAEASAIVEQMDREGGQTVFVNRLRTVTVEIEVAAVGIFSLFESRMQQHIPQGSFFGQLKQRLNAAGRNNLAERLHSYYLAVNVLKHGQGDSYNQLLNIPNLPFEVKRPGDSFFDEGDISEPEGLVNVTSQGFFGGLIDTLEEVRFFLEPA